MGQSFLNHQAQLTRLAEEKNLIVGDRQYAETMLKQIGYFPLVSSYQSPFKDVNGNYRDGTRFEDLVYLYKFDENLRELFLKYILKVECHLKSLIAYHFTEKYGDRQGQYLNPDHFTGAPGRRSDVLYMTEQLERLLDDCSGGGNVPLWVLINGLTFGLLAKLYDVSEDDVRAKVVADFSYVNEKQLSQMLSVMIKFRNVCAHNERLFSYQANRDIPDLPLHQKLGIPTQGKQYTQGKRDLFSMVIALRYLLPENDFKKFKRHFGLIFRHYRTYSQALSEAELLTLMGFPEKWQLIGKRFHG